MNQVATQVFYSILCCRQTYMTGVHNLHIVPFCVHNIKVDYWAQLRKNSTGNLYIARHCVRGNSILLCNFTPSSSGSIKILSTFTQKNKFWESAWWFAHENRDTIAAMLKCRRHFAKTFLLRCRFVSRIMKLVCKEIYLGKKCTIAFDRIAMYELYPCDNTDNFCMEKLFAI